MTKSVSEPAEPQSAAAKRRERDRLRRHNDILDAAEEVFFKKGVEQTTMDDIARAAALSRALLYVYFADKLAIWRGIVLRAGTALRLRFERALASSDSGVGQIMAIGEAYYMFSCESPEYFDVLTSVSTLPEPDQPDPQAAEMDVCREHINQCMVQALVNGLEDGTLSRQRIDDPLQTAFYLQGALHGVIMQTRSGKSRLSTSEDSDKLIRYTIHRLTVSIASLLPDSDGSAVASTKSKTRSDKR
ncbi:TetR/AcrR family transcriptional regulator [Pseudohongiella sp. O18]|uniref:TetR/AcrR family transcriptional regulator n=1 Tax=Pseudohongiella sp. O18 TaxID=2904248 RepID=UPI001F290715|nr:TetR/AcrR family transcriptional regulator [Pseudohongiella sp. O18]